MMSVVIIQRVLPHYRVPFFLQLEKQLSRRDIRLSVVYGQEYEGCARSWRAQGLVSTSEINC